HGNLVIAAIRIGIKCGSDTSLHVFKHRPDPGGWWSPFATLASPSSSSIGDAWGMLDYAAEADGRGGFLLAVADVNPWYSSSWQALRYRVYRSTRLGLRAVFADRRSIYIAVDDRVF